MKYILVALISILLYRFWDKKSALKEGKKEETKNIYTDYEEID